MRSFDQHQHTYLGFNIQVSGEIQGERRQFWLALGKGTYDKHPLQVGSHASGVARRIVDSRLESAEFFKVSGLWISYPIGKAQTSGPPWHGVPPSLEVYRERGHRRLSIRVYETNCISCIWGCRMPVEIIIDHWNRDHKKFRFETFCYGLKSCRFYKSGPTRKVPGRKGMTWEEEDWVDEEATSHRGPDD
jgi:hypothetical protein